MYVSFNGVTVGQVQGKTLTQCPQVKNQKSVQYVDIDGAPTDNNALLFAQGYDSVLSKTPGWTRVAKQTGNWDGPTAGRVFSQMLNKNPNIKAVMVANDTMAQAVITDLTRQHLTARSRSAVRTPRRVVCSTSWPARSASPSTSRPPRRPSRRSTPVTQLINGQQPSDVNATTTDPMTGKEGPVDPRHADAITKANVALPINDSTRRRPPCAPARTSASARRTASTDILFESGVVASIPRGRPPRLAYQPRDPR